MTVEPLSPCPQIASLDELRDDENLSVFRSSHIMDRNDMWVVEIGEDLSFVQESRDILGARTRSGLGTLIATARSRSSS